MTEIIKKTFLNLPGWQRGAQGLGLSVMLMAVIVAIMIFSFWVCSAGPFSNGKEIVTPSSTHSQPISNPGANAFRSTGSDNYSSSDVSQVLNKLQNSTSTSSQ
jgi:hypothetical protein